VHFSAHELSFLPGLPTRAADPARFARLAARFVGVYSCGRSDHTEELRKAPFPEVRLVDHLDRVAGEWRARADDLATWVMTHLANRTDVWGRYVRNKSEATTRAVTSPFAAERGKVSLDHDSLRKHFRQSEPGGQLGIHSASRDRTCRWLAIDIDRHDPDDQYAVSREGNLAAAQGWRQVLVDHGLDRAALHQRDVRGAALDLVQVFGLEPSPAAGPEKRNG
jgi:hypothetical protein